MPRGRRKAVANPSEEIAAIDQKISDLQEQISDLKKQRKAFMASGKTAEEFLADVSNVAG